MKPRSSKRIAVYQRSREENGLCRYCDNPIVLPGICAQHREINRFNALIYYRRQRGIPLSAPVKATGRPRIDDASASRRINEFLQQHPQVSPTTSLNGKHSTDLSRS